MPEPESGGSRSRQGRQALKGMKNIAITTGAVHFFPIPHLSALACVASFA